MLKNAYIYSTAVANCQLVVDFFRILSLAASYPWHTKTTLISSVKGFTKIRINHKPFTLKSQQKKK